MGKATVKVSKPVMKMIDLPWCKHTDVREYHEKTKFECKNITKQHCTSLWKDVNGEKVFVKNDDCRNVVWEDCKPYKVRVPIIVPRAVCTNETYQYLTFETREEEIQTESEECSVEKRVVCENRTEKKCGMLRWQKCSEVGFDPERYNWNYSINFRSPRSRLRWSRSQSLTRRRSTGSGASSTGLRTVRGGPSRGREGERALLQHRLPVLRGEILGVEGLRLHSPRWNGLILNRQVQSMVEVLSQADTSSR